MELKVEQWTALLCFCVFGIQSSMAWVQSMREIEQNCFRDGGYCINTIPPPPPRRRNNRRRPGAQGGGRMGTRTRTGSRPDPRALASTHTRLPGSSQPSGGAAPPPAAGAPAYTPPQSANAPNAYPPAGQSGQSAAQDFGMNLFGNNPNDPFGGMLGMMMFTRKKRQAGVPEPHERPRRRRGEGLYQFLNQHCRKSEFDFGCRREGGMCCLPFLK